jgi:hypothetical protein
MLSFVANWRAGTYRYAISATIKSKLMPAKLQQQYCYLILMYSEEVLNLSVYVCACVVSPMALTVELMP